jgi:hypothetical protein
VPTGAVREDHDDLPDPDRKTFPDVVVKHRGIGNFNSGWGGMKGYGMTGEATEFIGWEPARTDPNEHLK